MTAAVQTRGRIFVDVNGLRVRVFVHDDRAAGQDNANHTAIVLLHGAGGNYLQWPPGLRRLTARLVLSPDLPGHGGSDGDGFDTAAAYAGVLSEVVERLRSELGVRQVVAVGHSLGAAVALEYVRLAGDTVSGIGVLGCGVELPIPSDLIDLAPVDADVERRLIAGLFLTGEPSAKARKLYLQRLRQSDTEVLRRDLAACRAFDARSFAAQVEAPSTIVIGSKDHLVPLSSARELHNLMAHSDLRVLDGVGHMFLWERTDDVHRTVIELAARAANR